MNGSGRFNRFTVFLERLGIIRLVGLGFCVFCAIGGILRISIDTVFGVFMPRDSVATGNLERMEQVFGDQSQLICTFAVKGELRS